MKKMIVIILLGILLFTSCTTTFRALPRETQIEVATETIILTTCVTVLTIFAFTNEYALKPGL